MRAIAGLLALVNSALDILYAYTTIYVLEAMFIATCVLVVVKVLITMCIGQMYYTKYVRNYKLGMKSSGVKADDDIDEDVDERGRSKSMKEVEFIDQGKNLYAALHLLLYTGLFRLLPSKDFKYEIGLGYSVELIVSIFPMFICQMFNNAETDGVLTPL